MRIVLDNSRLYQTAIDMLTQFAASTHTRTPTLSLLLVLLYHRAEMRRNPMIPMISDAGQPGAGVGDITSAADLFFEKSHRPGFIQNPFDGTWRPSTRVKPNQNNWRNPIGPQAGFRCYAPLED